jgi:pimeloyl-ACP methyl ester carboxylesterase
MIDPRKLLFVGALGLAAFTLPSSLALAEARNIVLVHGMNIGGWVWRGVYDRLVADNYTVTVAQMPLTSFEADLAAVERVLELQQGPVVLVGHSYAGFILGEAGMDPDVQALVYVAGFQPDIGESQMSLTSAVPSELATESLLLFDDGHYLVDAEAWVRDVANGLNETDAWFTARSQIASNSATFQHQATAAAWKEKPTWTAIATLDRTIAPELQRQMSKRSGGRIVEIKGGHMIPMTNPDEIVSLIKQAAESVD